ncbi:alpha/beta hydrolase-fold protein [Arenibacter sp. GZD96]|uniref:alpha/beta hydrolase n=1 Tax=Aurantibrevibacter litoralis TaxID=3106030 RepID=UPI002AFF122F|nr:alpha/beta hydrolase-fold protein [Arenibacter sp. GZD-96]MEA1786827.1 alpha/beta hydrolase-fold protein [Arenibacter sp. GZD-96]
MKNFGLILILNLITIPISYCQQSGQENNTISKIHTDSIFSKYLEEHRRHNVYLPPYFDSKRNYRVIYGTDGNESSWKDVIISVLDSLIENEIIEPVIYIGSHSNNKNIASTSMKTEDGMTINIQYRNFEYVENFGAGAPFKALTDRFENHLLYFKDELIPFIEEKFGLNPTKRNRLFYGVSNGAGFGANFLNKHPDVIGTYICFSTLGSNVSHNEWKDNIEYPNLYLEYGNEEDEIFKNEANELKRMYEQSNSKCELIKFNGGHDYEKWNERFALKIAELLKVP